MSLQTCLFIIGWIRNDELIIFTKTREVEFIPASLISASPSYIVIIAFHLHARTVCIIIIVHMHWTKLESASIQFKGEDKVMGSQLNQQSCIWEPLNIFIMVFSSRPPKEIKEIKLFTRESSQQPKEGHEIFLCFLFNYYYKHGK